MAFALSELPALNVIVPTIIKPRKKLISSLPPHKTLEAHKLKSELLSTISKTRTSNIQKMRETTSNVISCVDQFKPEILIIEQNDSILSAGASELKKNFEQSVSSLSYMKVMADVCDIRFDQGIVQKFNSKCRHINNEVSHISKQIENSEAKIERNNKKLKKKYEKLRNILKEMNVIADTNENNGNKLEYSSISQRIDKIGQFIHNFQFNFIVKLLQNNQNGSVNNSFNDLSSHHHRNLEEEVDEIFNNYQTKM